MKRRNFIKGTALLAAPGVLLQAENPAEEKRVRQHNPGFSLRFMNTNWGFAGTREEFFRKTKEAGYDGVELWAPKDNADGDDILALAAKYELSLGLLCGGSDKNPNTHLEQFDTALKKAIDMRPLYINCHSGRDWFEFEQNKAFIELTTKASAASGIPIYHETHRGRMLFAAHVTRKFIEATPALRLTLDISHWCNVHESLLGDQEEAVALALARTDHIHARVGHGEGPQVNDPRAPEWETAVNRHLAWWDKVVEIKSNAGMPLTMLTEFGPPFYMPTLPYTRQSVADQWDINLYMKTLLRKRYLQ